ncbi:M48 family metalloprotease [Marivita hallyeonensis]|uniref:Putative Zn-dependent protease, contains TPR repeats n=1 Tax=Marivita hallyeonensis TaxID=996342 RepID=A0A1M5RCF5_9RHOB|nr:M48 family metalloprotease [Marivita hallyeonensis]SHH23726.1 Putative Zn-dependent protease, contains TPR repeats [Marivita hallyeonensis]
MFRATLQFLRVTGLALCFAATLALSPAHAVQLLRDADVEYALKQLGAPVLRAAGLSPNQVRILLVNDSSLNAFIIDTQHIFIHAGLMSRLDSAAQLRAVIAHEAAHIANGHIARRLGNMRSARTAAGLGMVLAAAAAAAGGGQAAAGVAIGTQSSVMRNFLAHTRAEESSADISSIRYLVRAGVDPQGAIEVQDFFRGQEALSERRQDPYMRSHPLTRDRLRALKGLVASVSAKTAPDPSAQYWFARAQGKLTAFTRAPQWTLRRADDSVSADIAQMRKAVAYHRQSDLRRALSNIDAAIASRPNDPFLRDLKGQILLESRRAGDAVAVYSAAARLAPREPLILGGLGRAHLAAGNASEALNVLEAARGRDFRDTRILRDLAVAYAKTGQNAMASLVTAERYALQGRLNDATIHAKRAEGALPRGSGPWKRAQDVLSAAQSAGRR